MAVVNYESACRLGVIKTRSSAPGRQLPVLKAVHHLAQPLQGQVLCVNFTDNNVENRTLEMMG